MRKRKLFVLFTGITLGVATAQAGSVLQGLEMDVMEAGETASQATSRIALPRAGAVGDDGSPDYAGLATEQALIGGERGGEAAAVDYDTNGAAGAPDPGEPVSGIDVGEPGPGELDGGATGEEPTDPGWVDGGPMGGEPPDSGWVEPEPGDEVVIDEPIEEPVEDPVDGTPIGDIRDGSEDGGEFATMPLEVPVEADGTLDN
jgi:hypothetical protein